MVITHLRLVPRLNINGALAPVFPHMTLQHAPGQHLLKYLPVVYKYALRCNCLKCTEYTAFRKVSINICNFLLTLWRLLPPELEFFACYFIDQSDRPQGHYYKHKIK